MRQLEEGLPGNVFWFIASAPARKTILPAGPLDAFAFTISQNRRFVLWACSAIVFPNTVEEAPMLFTAFACGMAFFFARAAMKARYASFAISIGFACGMCITRAIASRFTILLTCISEVSQKAPFTARAICMTDSVLAIRGARLTYSCAIIGQAWIRA